MSADLTGVVGSVSPRWLKSEQMFTAGYETVFSHDFNGDGLTGFFDDDGDGFVDDTDSYLFHTDDTPVSLTKAGRAITSRLLWYGTPIKAVSTDDGFAVLFSHPSKENVFQVVSTDDGGEWQTISKWKPADALQSYEELLDYDINGDTERGFVDLDGDGFTDGFTKYQFHSDAGPIAFTKAGRALSALNRFLGTPIKAVSTDDGFAVLFLHPSKENVFQVVSANQSGAWLNTSRWKKADWLWMNGYESLLNHDINGGGIGFSDDDGDGFLDDATKLNFLTDDGSLVPFRNAAGWQFKPTIMWSALQSVETETGFDVLIQHQFRHDTYKVIETDTDGRSINNKGTGWKTGNWMMQQGYEQHFNRNIDTDPIIGFSDQNADGFLDGASTLKMIHADGLVDFKDSNGVPYKVTLDSWDARKAVPTIDGFQVLLDQENIHGDLFYRVVTTGADGVTMVKLLGRRPSGCWSKLWHHLWNRVLCLTNK